MLSSLRATAVASRLTVAIAIALSISPCARAADAAATPTELDRVEVRGRNDGPATAPTPQQARERLRERAGGTSLVDAERYRDGRVSNLVDALGYAPGVFVQPRFGSEESRLSIRGSALQRTFHGRGVELLQDGSPLNLADGGFDFQAVEPLSARYIEVWRGANALEYGAATLGGAINFVSPTGYTAPPLDLRVEAGSDAYRRAQVAIAGQSGAADGYLSLTGFAQDGYRDHAQQETYRLFGNAGYRFSDNLDGRVYLTHVDTRSELPGSLTLAEARDNPRAAAPANVSNDQRRDFRLDRLAGKLAWTPADGQELMLSAFYARKSLHHPIFQVLDQDSRDVGVDLRWRGETTLHGHRNLLIAGITLAQGEIDDDRHANNGGQAGARSNQFKQRARNAKLYVENQFWLSRDISLSLGAQALRADRRTQDRFNTAGRDESFDADYAGVSPKLGLRWRLDGDSELFANVSRSLEPPSFGELSGGPGITQVDEQTATTRELGFRRQTEDLSLDLVYYRASVQDELLALTDAQGNPLGTTNAAHTLHQGIEAGLDWRFAQAWSAAFNYLWNDFRFDHDPVYGNNTLAGIPAQQLRAQLRWQSASGFYLSPNLDWAPQDYYIDHANSFRAPGYAVVGLRIGGEVGEGWSWFVDARNLQDRRWIASTGVVANAMGVDSRNFLPGDGRSFYVGLQWRPALR